MAFLDRAVGSLGGALPHLLNPETRLLQAALSLLSDNGQAGGLDGLSERFRRAGLAHILSSWIGSGPNLPASAQDIETALGDGHLQQISEETGLSQEEAASRLSSLLPQLIDRLTPEGQAPRGGLGDLSMLLERFMVGA